MYAIAAIELVAGALEEIERAESFCAACSGTSGTCKPVEKSRYLHKVEKSFSIILIITSLLDCKVKPAWQERHD